MLFTKSSWEGIYYRLKVPEWVQKHQILVVVKSNDIKIIARIITGTKTTKPNV